MGALGWLGAGGELGGHPSTDGPPLRRFTAATKLNERTGNVYENKGSACRGARCGRPGGVRGQDELGRVGELGGNKGRPYREFCGGQS